MDMGGWVQVLLGKKNKLENHPKIVLTGNDILGYLYNLQATPFILKCHLTLEELLK